MIVSKVFFTPSCDDVELKLKRKARLEYRVSYDSARSPRAVVFMVGGWGATKNPKLWDFEREYVTKTFGVICVQVYHHGIHRRESIEPRYSAKRIFEKEDVERVKKYCQGIGWDVSVDADNAFSIAHNLTERVKILKEQGALAPDFRLEFTLGLIPARDKYENAGLMSALDTLNALKALDRVMGGGGGGEILSLPKIYAGGSYGGYLALLCAKIAPWHADAVLDNSGSALPQVRFILGREMQTCDMVENFPHNQIQYFTRTLWSRREGAKHYFSDDAYLVRAILNAEHLKIQHAANPHTIFVSYHSAQDGLNPVADKKNLYEIYAHLGFDATLNLARDEGDVDGRLIKSLDHGLRMSDKAMIRKELPLVLEKLQGRKLAPASKNLAPENSAAKDPDAGGDLAPVPKNSIPANPAAARGLGAKNPTDGSAEICYPCKDKIYRFRETEAGLVCEILKKEADA
ncbi:DUF2920 family protein [Campylobacter sp.]|uniref:DUF2920 family protein n=1 Tax=Campylobacter sp. TaxID=205 RepID=UPI0026DD440C|nr:DUF2920 family protein [Campylobacter sp.]MDO4673957.1 DUF2920 family protein [Campylobacter sp.]